MSASMRSVRSPSCENTTARFAARWLRPSPRSVPTMVSNWRCSVLSNQRSVSWLRIARSSSTRAENGWYAAISSSDSGLLSPTVRR